MRYTSSARKAKGRSSAARRGAGSAPGWGPGVPVSGSGRSSKSWSAGTESSAASSPVTTASLLRASIRTRSGASGSSVPSTEA